MSNPLGPNLTSQKQQRIQQKKNELTQFETFAQSVDASLARLNPIVEAQQQEQIRRADIDATSWARNSELGTLSGQSKQFANRLAQGGLQILSDALTMPSNQEAASLYGKLDDAARNALNKELTNQPLTEEEERILSTPIGGPNFELPTFGSVSPYMGTSMHLPKQGNNPQTPREIYNRIIENLTWTEEVEKNLTEDTVVAKSFNPLNREAQAEQFAKAWEESGIEQAEGFWENASAVFDLALSGGEALIDNPASTIEYAAESLPGAASTAVPGMAVFNSLAYGSDVLGDRLRPDEENPQVLSREEQQEAMGEAALAAALDHVGDLATAKAAGIIGRSGTKAKPELATTNKELAKATGGAAGKRTLSMLGSSATEFATEATQTAIEEDAFGEDFNLEEDGQTIYEAGFIGAGASGATASPRQATKLAKEIGENALNTAKTSAQTSRDENAPVSDEDAKSRTESAITELSLNKNYSEIIDKSTSKVEKDEKLDISKIAGTISRRFSEATKQAKKSGSQEDIEAARENYNILVGLRDEAGKQYLEIDEKIRAARDSKNTDVQLSETELTELMARGGEIAQIYEKANEATESLATEVAKLNNAPKAIDSIKASENRDEDFEINAQRIFETDTISPETITVEQMESLLALDKWTPEERARIERSVNSKRAMSLVDNSRNLESSTPNEVRKDIFIGRAAGSRGRNDRGTNGIKTYREQIGLALVNNDIEKAKDARNKLAAFAEKHRAKANALNVAFRPFERVGKNGNYTVTPNQEEVNAAQYLRQEHNFNVSNRSRGLIKTINDEAAALEAVLAEVDGLISKAQRSPDISVAANESAATENSQATQEVTSVPTQAATATAVATPTPESKTETKVAANDPIQSVAKTTQPKTETQTQTQEVEPQEEATQDNKTPLSLTVEQVGDVGVALAGSGGNASVSFGAGSLVAKQARDAAESIQFEMYGGMSFEDALQKARNNDSLGTDAFEKAARQMFPDSNESAQTTEPEQTPSQTEETVSEPVSEANTGEVDTEVNDADSETVVDNEDVDAEEDIATTRAKETQLTNQVEQLRKDINDQDSINAFAAAENGVEPEDFKNLDKPTKDAVKRSARKRKTDLLNQLEQTKNELRQVRKDREALEGRVRNHDGIAEAFENETFKKLFKRAPLKTLARSIPNLVSQLQRTPSSVLAFTKGNVALNNKQKTAIKHYAQFAESFSAVLESKFPDLTEAKQSDKFQPQWHLQDAFIKDGKLIDAAKAGLSAAVYSWLANNARSTRFIERQTIATRFNIKDSDKVPYDLFQSVNKEGVPTNMVYRSLGSSALRAMGIRLNKDKANYYHEDQLKLQLGTLMVAAMQEMGLVELRSRPMSTITEKVGPSTFDSIVNQLGLSEKVKNDPAKLNAVLHRAPYSTVRVKTDSNEDIFNDDEINAAVKDIIDVNKDTDYIIESLFETTDVVREPSLEPSDEVKEGMLMKKTLKKVSDATKSMIRGVQQKPMRVVKDNHFIISALSDSERNAVIGIVDSTRLSQMPKRMRDAAEAKNNGLKREWENYTRWTDKLLGLKGGLDKAFYLGMEVWNYGRFGYTNQTINPQTSKLHRGMVKMDSWTKELRLDDEKNLNAFKLGIAQGLDIDIDKQSAEATLDEVDAKVFDPTSDFYQAAEAINVLKTMTSEEIASDEGKALRNQIVGAVKKGKHNTHSLHALTNLGRYIAATQTEEPSFEADIWLEIDGITNGVVIGSIIFGNGFSGDLKKDLEAGGIFFNEKRDYGEHISANVLKDNGEPELDPQGKEIKLNSDYYNRQSKLWTARLRALVEKVNRNPNSPQAKRLRIATKLLTGKSASDPSLTILRKLSKPFVMQNVYGAGRKSLSEELATMLVDSFDSFLDDRLNNMSDKAQALKDIKVAIAAMNQLANVRNGRSILKIDGDVTLQSVRDAEYDKKALDDLAYVIQKEFAAPMFEAIDDNFENFKANRAVYIDNMKNLNKVFVELYEKRLETKRKELVESGAIEANDLLPERYKEEIAASLSNIMPSAMNVNGDGTPDTYLQSATYETRVNKAGKSVEMKPQNGYTVMAMQPDGSYAPVTRKRMTAAIEERGFSENIGPGAGVQTIHGNDAGIIQAVLSKYDVVNVHDGIPASFTNFEEVGKTANEAFLNNVFNYNPFKHLKGLMDNAETQIQEMRESGEITNQEASQLLNTLKTTKTKYFGKTKRIGTDYQQLLNQVENIDQLQAELRDSVEHVSQYYLPGTGYETERGQANRLARENDEEVSQEESTINEESSVAPDTQVATSQRTAEMEQKRIKPDTAIGLQTIDVSTLDENSFEVQFENALNETSDIKSAFNKAVKATGQKGYYVDMVSMIIEQLPDDFELTVITPNSSAETLKRFNSVRGGHIKGTARVALKSNTFKYSGMRLETLAHELLHVMTANTIEGVESGSITSDRAVTAVKRLKSLLEEVKEDAAKKGINLDNRAVENAQEFLAWGLTNRQFAQQLRRLQVKTPGTKKLTDAFKAFVSTIKSFFGGKLRNDEPLRKLIELTGLIMQEDAKLQPRKSDQVDINAQRIQEMSPTELIQALSDKANGNPEHTEHLKRVQESVVNAFAGPMGVDLKLTEDAQGDMLDQYLAHLNNGTNPFLNTLQDAFTLSNEEAFVAEQLEAAIESKILEPGFVKDKMYKSWLAAKESLTYESFLPDPAYKNDPNEVAKAKAKYDYLFTSNKLNKGKYAYDKLAGKYVDNRQSDFLTRFTVAAATVKEVRDLLANVDAKTPEQTGSFISTLNRNITSLFDYAEEKLNGNTHVPSNVKKAHDTLLERMAQTTHKNRYKLNMIEQKSLDVKSAANRRLSKLIKGALNNDTVNRAMDSDRPFVAAAGSIAYLIGNNAISPLVETMRKIFKSDKESTPSFFNQLVTEVGGRSIKGMDEIITEIRRTNRDVEQERQFTKETMRKLLDQKLGKLNEVEQGAVHRALLSTDASRLLELGYTTGQVESFLSNPDSLNQEISKVEEQLMRFEHNEKYVAQSRALGYYMVTNNATTRMLHKNAKQIANLVGLNLKVRSDDVEAAVEPIDILTTLNAIKYVSTGDKEVASRVMRKQRSRTDGTDGIEYLLKQHAALRDEAMEMNFDGDEMQMQKGYTPEITDPNITVAWARVDSDKARDLEKRGYRLVQVVDRDGLLDHTTAVGVYTIEDGGMMRRVTGAASFTSAVARGTNFMDSAEHSEMPIAYRDRKKILGGMTGNARKDALAKMDSSFDPEVIASRGIVMMIPTYHVDGSVKDFRYEMSNQLRDRALNKHYDLGESLGTMAGNIIDKRNTKSRNRALIDALAQQYNNDPNVLENDYVTIGAKVQDPQLREYWDLLPHDAKMYAIEKFGKAGIPIKRELLNVTMGFRKPSLADVFTKDKEALGAVQKLIRQGVETILGADRTPAFVEGLRKTENFFAYTTSVVKDNVVVKNLFTTLFNIVSNFLHLLANDIPVRHAFSGTVRGWREAAKYNKYRQKQYEIEREMAITPAQTDSYRKLMSELNQVKTMMTSSPVHPLMQAGLFQTIVEDIDTSTTPFSYKGKIARKMEKWSSSKRVGPLAKFGKYMYVTQDTKLYKMMNQPIQLSDFAARFAMYEFLTQVSPERIDSEEALNQVSEHFVNYDIPTSPQLQWLNDHGLMLFSKYYLRILKPVYDTFLDKPASTVLSLMLTSGNLLTSPLETVVTSSVFDKITNPVSSALDAWDEPLPLNAVLHAIH